MVWLILIFALILRLPFIHQSLWLDEAIEALALMGKKGPILKYALADFQPPIYHFILKFWTNIFGYSEIALRTPSLIFSLLSIWFAIKIAREIGNRRSAIITGLLLATNPLHIYYSAEGRTYMLTTFLVTASFYYFLKLKRSAKVEVFPPKGTLPSAIRSTEFLYLLFTIASLWSSYLAWIAIGLQLLYLLYLRRFDLLKYPLVAFATLVFWLPSVLRQLNIGFSTVAHSPNWGRVVGGFELIRLPRTWFKFIAGRVSFVNKKLYLLIMFTLFSFHFLYLKKAWKAKYRLLWLWLLGSILIAYFLSLFVPVYQYFRLLFTLPAYTILLALGVILIPRRYQTISIIILVTVHWSLVAYSYFTPRFHKEAWRELVTYLHSQPPGLVALPSLAQDAPLQYYQLKYPLIELPKTTTFNNQTVYYIDYAEDLFDTQRLGRRHLQQQNYTSIAEKTFPNLHLIIFKPLSTN